MTADTQVFQNPTGFWKHDGAFSIEFINDLDFHIRQLPQPEFKFKDKTVRVDHGGLGQDRNWVQFFAFERNDTTQIAAEAMRFMHKVKAIRDGEDNLLWVNNNHK